MDPSLRGGDMSSSDPTLSVEEGTMPLNGTFPVNSNGFTSNGAADHVTLPNGQAITAGEI